MTAEGRFHSFRDITSLPRPTQRPRPPFYVAALSTPQSFRFAGAQGHGVMAIPMAGGMMVDLIATYREAWRAAGHPGQGTVMLAFHMFCNEDGGLAAEIAREPLNRYLRSLVDAASLWTEGMNSKDYPNYDKIIAALARETFETQTAKGAAWVGPPARLIEAIEAYDEMVGGFDIASMQVNFNTIPAAAAERSMRLFGEQVMPHFGVSPAGAGAAP